jgi:hypothetical protein
MKGGWRELAAIFPSSQDRHADTSEVSKIAPIGPRPIHETVSRALFGLVPISIVN